MVNQSQRGSKYTYRSLLVLLSLLLGLSPAMEARQTMGTSKKAASSVDKPVKKSQLRRSYRSKRAKPVPAQKNAAEPTAVSESQTSKSIKTQLESFAKQVDVKKANGEDWGKAKSKMNLTASDQIRTGRQSLARLKLEDGSKVLLLQNSQAEMEDLSSVQKTIKLLRGKVRAIVSKIQGGNNFKIKTPIGVASVRGTDFEVTVTEDGQEMSVNVLEGQVGVSRLGDLADEVLVNAGEQIKFGVTGELGDPIRMGAIPLNRSDVRAEVMDSQARDSVVAMAAEESRNADYQVGKSLIDVTGRRVRVEEYITRPSANQYKLVVLNTRASRFDYYTYTGTFNTALPDDLSIALRQVGGKLGAVAPDYYLTSYETKMSNTIDAITDSASGGHLVEIDFDGTTYTLTDAEDGSNTRTIDAAEDLGNGTFKIYNPLKDAFRLVAAADKNEAMKVGVLEGDTYRDFTSGDTYWKTRFNTYSFNVNEVVKTAYSKKTAVNNTLAIDFDANFSDAPLTAISELPSGETALHNRLSLYYDDGSKLVYDNYLIDDAGTIISSDDFNGISTSSEYKDSLDGLNYETRISATEFGGRTIDLIIDPRIATQSGLIQ